MSLALNTDYCRSHWEAIEEGARKAGKTPSRKEWRLVRDVYVADTDEEAREAAVGGMTARVWRDYLLRIFREFDLIHVFKDDPDVPDDDVTPEYMADHMWLVGFARYRRRQDSEAVRERGRVRAGSSSSSMTTGRTRRGGKSPPACWRKR